MFAGKSRKVKAQILKDANNLKLEARDKSSMSPKFIATVQELIDDLERTTFVKSKDKQLSLKNFQNIFNDIVSAYNSENESKATYTCGIFRDNLKKMSGKTAGTDGGEPIGMYSPEQLAELAIQHLLGAQDNYAKENKRLEREKEKLYEQLSEDKTNPAIAARYKKTCNDISVLDKKIKSVMYQIDLYNDRDIRKALIESMKEVTSVQSSILADPETSDEVLGLIQDKFEKAQELAQKYKEGNKKAEDIFNNGSPADVTSKENANGYSGTPREDEGKRNYWDELQGNGSMGTNGTMTNGELFKNVEKVRDGYNLEALYYKYKVQDASEERDKLVSEVKELLKKHDTASEVERTTLDGDIRAKNNQVDALTQSIKRYQSAWNAATQKAGVAQRVITEKDISTAQSYNPFAKEFESNLQEYAMELSRRAEQRNVEAGDLAAITEIIDSVQPDFEMGLSGTPVAEAEEDSSAEFDEMKKKYGV